MVLETAPFSIAQAAEEVAEILSERASSKGLDPAVRIDEKVPTSLLGDTTRFRQIITNLIGNAIKFTAEGHVLIDLSVEKFENDDVVIKCQVKDTGIGIPKEQHKNIFELFTQADDSTTRKFGGTGLGLAISKLLIEQMNGDIYVESEPGEGSNFIFLMHLIEDASSEKFVSNEELKELPALLLIEEGINKQIITGYCSEWGVSIADVCLVGDVKEKLNGKNAPRILLYDQQLVSNDDLLSLQKLDEYREIPKIALISRGDGHISKSLEENELYLFKPVRKHSLYLEMVRLLKLDGEADNALVEQPKKMESLGRKAKLLLAEDNMVNQQVALGMLMKLGLDAEIANNGREAYELVQKNTYDLVFMDCQMPEMSGFDATENIRQLDDDEKSDVTIIALTANAMEGDREKCLASGMSDYLAKPFKPEHLRDILKKWLPEESIIDDL